MKASYLSLVIAAWLGVSLAPSSLQAAASSRAAADRALYAAAATQAAQANWNAVEATLMPGAERQANTVETHLALAERFVALGFHVLLDRGDRGLTSQVAARALGHYEAALRLAPPNDRDLAIRLQLRLAFVNENLGGTLAGAQAAYAAAASLDPQSRAATEGVKRTARNRPNPPKPSALPVEGAK